jgi:hypothetical protein
VIRWISLLLTCVLTLNAADQAYYWKSAQVDDSAQLVTLFSRDVPLVSVLRDQLGTDQVSHVWLLTYSRPNIFQRALSAVPFFYWKVASGSTKVRKSDLKPLINLNLPQRSLVRSSVRNIIQWTVLDPISTPVRASTRAYQNNKHDHELLHLEEAKSYLQSAPNTYLTEKERDTIMARIDLRQNMLGDFVSSQQASQFGQNSNLDQEQIRERNWELLRQCADKTGLIFEPIDLAGTRNQYAIVWATPDRRMPTPGVRLGPVWKLLNIKDPGPVEERIPLGVYSLMYPKMPLLLVDFRDGLHLKGKELTQRAINEITSGVIGLSHFANWYYFVGADLYNFYQSRRGTATNQKERLNCYSKFRVALALDHSLDADLRADMQKRVNSIAVNPLESSAKNEFKAAIARYQLLRKSPLIVRVEKDRRAELARFEATKAQQIRADLFHYATFGLYTRRANGEELSSRLAHYRVVNADLDFLEELAAPGTAPEVAQDSKRIQRTVAELTSLLPEIDSDATQDRAERTIEKIRSLSADSQLKAQCVASLSALRGTATAANLGLFSGSAESVQ